jgi:5-methyltetrahydrofolate--homocysteine methyltransferase
MELMEQISAALIEGQVEEIEKLTQKALEAGKTAKEILDEGLIPGMDYVGGQFKKRNMFIPEVLLSARTMQASLSVLKPRFVESGTKMRGKVILGTVKGDLHDIGKNLVGIMLEGAGFEVCDLGKDVDPEAFVNAVKEEKPDIVGMSALLTTTMRTMQNTINALAEAGIRDRVKIMVGGAPVTADFARQIGADGYGPDAVAAVALAKRFVSA